MDFLNDSIEQARGGMHLWDPESFSSARGHGSLMFWNQLAGPGRAFPKQRANSVSPTGCGISSPAPAGEGKSIVWVVAFFKAVCDPGSSV